MDIKAILKENKLSPTKPRLNVFGLIAVADRPLSIKEIIKQSPASDRATCI